VTDFKDLHYVGMGACSKMSDMASKVITVQGSKLATWHLWSVPAGSKAKKVDP